MRLEDGGWAGLRAGPGITGVTPSAVTRPGDQGGPGGQHHATSVEKHRSEIQRRHRLTHGSCQRTLCLAKDVQSSKLRIIEYMARGLDA